ncbi:translation initiation factor IF-2-like [Monodelphis domestica]|uniref:translation initiation factor IF-2-like n=1 Tax=Monodelphis domestica TaxID=13616 RepID=UPI0024E1D66F|nr:translation initiation factor IF-2-like [Monodelphis domestica]
MPGPLGSLPCPLGSHSRWRRRDSGVFSARAPGAAGKTFHPPSARPLLLTPATPPLLSRDASPASSAPVAAGTRARAPASASPSPSPQGAMFWNLELSEEEEEVRGPRASGGVRIGLPLSSPRWWPACGRPVQHVTEARGVPPSAALVSSCSSRRVGLASFQSLAWQEAAPGSGPQAYGASRGLLLGVLEGPPSSAVSHLLARPEKGGHPDSRPGPLEAGGGLSEGRLLPPSALGQSQELLLKPVSPGDPESPPTSRGPIGGAPRPSGGRDGLGQWGGCSTPRARGSSSSPADGLELSAGSFLALTFYDLVSESQNFRVGRDLRASCAKDPDHGARGRPEEQPHSSFCGGRGVGSANDATRSQRVTVPGYRAWRGAASPPTTGLRGHGGDFSFREQEGDVMQVPGRLPSMDVKGVFTPTF